MGPFRVRFAAKGIKSVTIGKAKWNSEADKDIYWSETGSTESKDWSNKFNKSTSGKYTLDGKRFYLAVKTSQLPDEGTYTVSIKQDKFQYYNARIAVCVGSEQQQTGLYLYDNAPHTVDGEVSWTLKRKGLKTLIIAKVDEKTNKEISGAKFKIYAELKNGTKGWVSGDAKGTKTYGNQATEYDAKTEIKNLKYGKYYIYETKAAENYDLTEQKGYHKEAAGSSSLKGDWVYIGSKSLVAGTGEKITYTAKNKALANIEIVKKDKTTGLELSGGKFKLYAVLSNGTKGWVSGNASDTKTYGDQATEYTSFTQIGKLKYGTYYLYETEAPEGYDITKQDGYHQKQEGSDGLTGDWAYLGTQVLNVDSTGEGIFKFEAFNKKIVNDLEGDVWIDNPDGKNNQINHIYDGEKSNDKLKEGITVNLYDGNGNQLATTKTDSKGHYKFTTKNSSAYTGDDKNIYYWDLADAYVEFIYNNKTTYNEDGSVKEYGYVSVNPFTGTDAKINSKAQEYTVTTAKLDDNNLTGTDGENPGRAITNKDAKISDVKKLLDKNKEISDKINDNKASEDDLKNVPLACYYDNKTFKVSNINLGLLEQYDANFDVQEKLAYIKVNMKGYTYTYRYGEPAATDSSNVPTVNKQNSSKSYTTDIYPTDIAYNVANSTDELKVYVVYSIDVNNTESMNVDNLYVEKKIYLDSLVNTFDTDRYDLCNNENNTDNSDFALWTDNGNGTASYDVNNKNSVFKDGIENGKYDESGKFIQGTSTSYIQFKMKDEVLRSILETGSDPYKDRVATTATAQGYHEYLRTDNAWVHNKDVRAFDGAKGEKDYPTLSKSNKKYYVHRTISKAHSSPELYLKLALGEARKISGTVFEDTKTEEKEEGTTLGNGKLDDNEANRAQDVVVELLDQDKTTVSKLYKVENRKVVYDANGQLPDARTTTQEGGKYEFDGVVPGYYYIRFTYGDGSQKIMPAGTELTSNDYKSTIVNTENDGAGDLIKNAMQAKAEDLKSASEASEAERTEAQNKLVEWYKYLNGQNYSTAVDDLDQRSKSENYEYKDDGKVYDKTTGQEITDFKIDAFTPMLGISIENDINTSTDDGNSHKPNYEGFNFGLIQQPETKLIVNKKITNVKFTTQTGTTLVSANPKDRTATYITDLSKEVEGGSTYAMLELDKSLIYGSSLETTYEITIENNSEKDYIETDSNEFGTYYYYGKMSSSSKLKAVKVNQVVDELDNKYSLDPKQESSTANVVHSDNGTETKEITITKNNTNGSSATTNTITLTGWADFESGASESMSYTVSSLLSADDDTSYANKARITSISLDTVSALKSSSEWKKEATTTLSLTPPTGSDRRPIYWIAGTVGLIVLATGIVFIKKKVLKK